ncbi:unnamed protein product [Microthlaspi erraticum]|uniref:Uncharacterized protein n=1 Tax=Microthlaspi erraticum TaxID=1685480 RepID=A0A6D2K139_9BRAS|nr:unnamed protein product [Microthlaspi erraticum]
MILTTYGNLDESGLLSRLVDNAYDFCSLSLVQSQNYIVIRLILKIVGTLTTEFWGELKVNPEEGPTWEELVRIMPHSRRWSDEKKKRLGLLLILSISWGRVGFEKLIKSVQVVDLAGDSYVVHGCVHVLLIWAYELVTVLGELFGRRIQGIEVPLIRWGCGQTCFVLEDVLKKDKKENEDKKKEKKRKRRENKSEEKSDEEKKKKQQKKKVPENEMNEESEKENASVDMSIKLKDV